MKDNSILDQDITNLEIGSKSKDYILGAAKWSRYVAVISILVSFIFLLGLLGIIASIFFAPTVSKEIPNGGDVFLGFSIISFIFLSIILFTSIPGYYLFRFSTRSINAIKMASSQQLGESFKHLQSLFKYITILTISIFVIYFTFLLALGFYATTDTF